MSNCSFGNNGEERGLPRRGRKRKKNKEPDEDFIAFKCPFEECDLDFSGRGGLYCYTFHMADVHEMARNFKCRLCEIEFLTR